MQRLDINLRLSRQFCGLYSGLLLISLAIIAALNISISIKCILSGAVMAYVFRIFYQQSKWHTLQHDQSGWHLHYGNKTWKADIANDSTVTHWVSVLRFTPIDSAEKKLNCVVFNDMTTRDQYRQLILHARYFKQGKTAKIHSI